MASGRLSLLLALKSRRRAGKPGVPPELRQLIREMGLPPLWGAPRIHGELLKLGIDIGQTSVAKYMARRRRPPSQGWRTFLLNHADGIASIDLFVVPTISFKLLYGLLIFRHDRRRILWVGVTPSPTAGWIARQVSEACGWEPVPDYLVRDRDRVYGEAFTRRIRVMGIRDRPTAPRSPWQNGYAERLIGSIRRECLDHVIVFGERHLRHVLFFIDERPTYGYRRVWALLNRHLRSAGKPTVNMKRVLRIMQNHGLTLERHTARRPDRAHDGVIIALHSNIRWCSDHLELHARNREVVRILFVLDACDREIIAWSAVANAGISGEMVRDLMIAAVERRFKRTCTPHPVDWLSDNGSAHRKDTAESRALRPDPALNLSAVPKATASRRASSKPSSAITLASTSCMMPTQSLQCSPIGSKPMRDPPALRPEVPIPSGVHPPQCLNPPAKCPIKWGAHHGRYREDAE